MTKNPYLPPQAHVADAAVQPAVLERPVQVRIAVALLSFSMGIGVLATALKWESLNSLGYTGLLLSVQFLTFSIIGWFYFKIWQGRNWARITLLVLTIIGLPFSLMDFPARLQLSSIRALLGGVQIFMNLAAVYLLFSKAGRLWFKLVEVHINHAFKSDAPEDARN